MGIGQGVVARPEEAEDGREGAEQNHPEGEAHHDVEDDDIAQDAARRFVVFLSETDAHQRRPAHADHRAEGGGECHERMGERQAGNGELAHALPDEDGVDDVVERRSHHRDDGGQGILEQKRSDGALSEFCEVVVLCHGRVLCCDAPLGGRTLCVQMYEEMRALARKTGCFCWPSSLGATNLRSGLKKVGRFCAKCPYFSRKVHEFSAILVHFSFALVFASEHSTSGWAQAHVAVKKGCAVAPTGTKNPRLRRGEDGECGRKTTECGAIKGLCSYL